MLSVDELRGSFKASNFANYSDDRWWMKQSLLRMLVIAARVCAVMDLVAGQWA